MSTRLHTASQKLGITATLEKLGIEFQAFEHPPVLTCEESQELCPDMPGLKNKNLFLRDKKKNSYLVSMAQDKQVPLKDLSSLLGTRDLSFASPERLDEFLKVQPGSVGLLALINDSSASVKAFIDEDLMTEEWFQSHPGVNDSTYCIRSADIPKLLSETGHSIKTINLS